MSKPNSTRKTRSDKFPLTLHPTGQYCKKIKGKLYYFGNDKKAAIKTKKGVGFYTLRRTAATLTAKSGDPFAVQRLLGHANLKMATTYIQDVSEQTDKAINNSRKLISIICLLIYGFVGIILAKSWSYKHFGEIAQ